ncbi:MAG: hypothetical protein ACQERC_03475 [Bacteroidota bacterium]
MMSITKIKTNLFAVCRSHPNWTTGLFYLLVLAICFDELFFGNATLKWDAFRLWFPWKHFVVNELLNGNLPLWNPYHLGGFPQHGDSMTWYPVSWIFGFISGGYNLTSLNLEYLFHLFLAGFGLYKFVRLLHLKWLFCALLGMSYMLSGFMLGNAQHMGWVVSAAWLPWVAIYLFRLVQQPGWRNALRFSLVGYLFFSGGYLALFFIALYFILGYVIYGFFKQRINRFRIIGFSLLSLALIVLLSAPVLFSFIDLSPLLDRASPESMGSDFNINYGGTPLNGILAIFFPLASGIFNVPEIPFGTFSTFFGSIPVLLILIRWRKLISDKKALFLFIAGIFFLLVSIGQPLPFRDFLSYFPFLDLFRYPTIFRLFAIFIFLALLAVMYRDFSFDVKQIARIKKYSVLLVIGWMFFVAMLVISSLYLSEEIFSIQLLPSPVDLLSDLNEGERILLNLIVTFIVTCVLVAGFSFYRKYAVRLIVIVWVLELMLIASLATESVVNEPVNVRYANQRLDQQPKAFTGLAEHYAEHEENDWESFLDVAWEGKSILLKQPSQNGFSPMKLKDSQLLQRAEVHLPDSCGFLSRISIREKGKTTVLPTRASFYPLGTSEWKIVTEEPLGEDEYFVLKQRKTPNWQLLSEEFSTFEFTSTREGFMLIKAPGSREIHLNYSKEKYVFFWMLFVVGLFIISAVLLVASPWSKDKNKIIAVVVVLSILGVYQNWDRWFPTSLPKIPGNKITSGTDYENLESYFNNIDRGPVYVAQNTPKKDRFLDELNYFMKKEGQYTIGSSFSKYEQSRHSSFEVCRIAGTDFKKKGYKIDLTPLITEKLQNESVFIRLDFSNPENRAVQLWLNHKKSDEWINGKAWNLDESIQADNNKNTFIRSIDLNKYDTTDGSTVTLFLSSEENLDAFDVHQVIVERYR